MQGQKDREWTQILSMHKGLVSPWQEAISTCSYTTCFISLVASDLHGLLLRRNKGNLAAGAIAKARRALYD